MFAVGFAGASSFARLISAKPSENFHSEKNRTQPSCVCPRCGPTSPPSRHHVSPQPGVLFFPACQIPPRRSTLQTAPHRPGGIRLNSNRVIEEPNRPYDSRPNFGARSKSGLNICHCWLHTSPSQRLRQSYLWRRAMSVSSEVATAFAISACTAKMSLSSRSKVRDQSWSMAGI